MKRKVPKLVTSLFALTLLLFGGNLAHAMFSHSMTSMPSSQCQSNCISSQTPANTAVKPGDVLKDKDLEPEPAEPYYLVFMGVGWTKDITIATAFLFGYLLWRPPDLYKLNVAYRF
jgi:hypothetical protein